MPLGPRINRQVGLSDGAAIRPVMIGSAIPRQDVDAVIGVPTGHRPHDVDAELVAEPPDFLRSQFASHALIYSPPLILIVAPVIKLAPGLARKATTAAISSGVPILPAGIASTRWRPFSEVSSSATRGVS